MIRERLVPWGVWGVCMYCCLPGTGHTGVVCDLFTALQCTGVLLHWCTDLVCDLRYPHVILIVVPAPRIKRHIATWAMQAALAGYRTLRSE